MTISEASVERAFSRHKLVHSRLRANLSAKRLNDTLFVRYIFETSLKISQSVQEVQAVQEEIENWREVNTDKDDYIYIHSAVIYVYNMYI